MAKVDPMPDDETLEKRRRPQFIINPKDVTQSDNERVRQWMGETIRKHESKLDLKKWKIDQIVTAASVEPEAIDVRGIYPFSDLHWIIFREGKGFSIMLVGRNIMLCKSHFKKT